MGGGDHHARVGVQAADRVGEQGSGQRARHDPGPHARGGHDRGRVLGELPGVVARIVSDGHEGVGPCGLRQVGDESRGRLAHHRPVHAARPGGHRAAQPGRAELEEAGEAVVQLGGGRRVARLRGVQEPFEFGAAFFVRIVGDPFAHAVGAIHRRSLRRRRAVRAGGEPSRRRGCARRRTPRVGPGLPRRMSAWFNGTRRPGGAGATSVGCAGEAVAHVGRRVRACIGRAVGAVAGAGRRDARGSGRAAAPVSGRARDVSTGPPGE